MSYNHLELSYVVPVYITNPDTNILHLFLEHYAKFSTGTLDKIQFIFVDDCSPLQVTIPEKYKFNYILARIKNDITWNQGGARNLGVHLAKTSKLILTDLDHVFPEKLIKDMIDSKEPHCLYQFRREAGGVKTGSHPNTFFCTKGTYFKVLGVDEEFCGNYGYEDVYFTEMQKAAGTKIKKYSRIRIIKNEHKDTTNELHHLKRDSDVNKELLDKKLQFIRHGKPFAGHSRLFLNFEWEILKDTLA